jgi:hypothetical protein
MKEINLTLENKVSNKIMAEISLPGFVHKKMDIVICHNGKERKILLSPGESMKIEEEIREDKAQIDFKVSNTWSPKQILKSEDARELGVFVESLTLVGKDGNVTDLKENM